MPDRGRDLPDDGLRPARAPLPSRFYAALTGLAVVESEEDHRRRQAMGLLQNIGAAMERSTAEAAARSGIHPTDLFVLALLHRVGPDRTAKVAALQKSLGFTSGGVTRRLDKMEEAGLAERLADPDDGRAWLVRLTPKGVKIAAQALEKSATRNARLQAEFSQREWNQLIGLLARLESVLVTG